LCCTRIAFLRIRYPKLLFNLTPSLFSDPIPKAYANGTLYPRGPLALVALDGTANDPGGDNDWKSPDGVPAVHLYKAMEDRCVVFFFEVL